VFQRLDLFSQLSLLSFQSFDTFSLIVRWVVWVVELLIVRDRFWLEYAMVSLLFCVFFGTARFESFIVHHVDGSLSSKLSPWNQFFLVLVLVFLIVFWIFVV
jgi:hypothetical protein